MFCMRVLTKQNEPKGDIVGWKIDNKHFWVGKIIEISVLDENTIPLMLVL